MTTEDTYFNLAVYGLSFDEAFHKLKNGEDLGDPLDYFPLNLEIEKAIGGDIE